MQFYLDNCSEFALKTLDYHTFLEDLWQILHICIEIKAWLKLGIGSSSEADMADRATYKDNIYLLNVYRWTLWLHFAPCGAAPKHKHRSLFNNLEHGEKITDTNTI